MKSSNAPCWSVAGLSCSFSVETAKIRRKDNQRSLFLIQFVKSVCNVLYKDLTRLAALGF